MAKQLKGDINNDGKITSVDLNLCFLALSHALELDADEIARADVDGDGSVGLVDARKILQHIEGTVLIDEVIE
jgi:hypothetical protein